MTLRDGRAYVQSWRARAVTVGIARFQLKQVLAKAQADRKADLVRRIYSSDIAA